MPRSEVVEFIGRRIAEHSPYLSAEAWAESAREWMLIIAAEAPPEVARWLREQAKGGQDG